MAFPTNNQTVRLTGKCRSPTDILYFYDIMAVNYKTTETDDCLSWQSLGDHSLPCKQHTDYTVYVATLIKEAEMAGYNPNRHHLLLWNTSNTNKGIIVRFLYDLDSKRALHQMQLLDQDNAFVFKELGVPTIEYMV